MPIYRVTMEVDFPVVAATPEAAIKYARYSYDIPRDCWRCGDFTARPLRPPYYDYEQPDEPPYGDDCDEGATVRQIVDAEVEAEKDRAYLASLPQLPFEGEAR